MEIRILSIASVIISMILYCSAFEENSQNANGKAVPIILFHGYGGVCDIKLQNYLNEKLGVFALCVEPSPDPAKAANYSIYTPIRIQGESACNMINQNQFFNGEFDLIGFSQGTIISRYIIQYCNLKGKVRNFVAFGGPLNGQSYKRCAFYDIQCMLKNLYYSYLIFTADWQKDWAPTNYFKDPSNYVAYLNNSTFLAEANNERYFSDEMKQKFLNLNRCMFIKWDDERTIQPAESSWWGEYDINFNPIHRNSTILYQKDLIGIKTLEIQGRAKFVNIPGGHMNYTFSQIDNIIIPFLLGN